MWTLGQDGSLYIEERADGAGHGTVLTFVDDLDAHVAALGARGLQPDERHTYTNGVPRRCTAIPTARRSDSAARPTQPDGRRRRRVRCRTRPAPKDRTPRGFAPDSLWGSTAPATPATRLAGAGLSLDPWAMLIGAPQPLTTTAQGWHRRQRELVAASLAALPRTARPTHRRWA